MFMDLILPLYIDKLQYSEPSQNASRGFLCVMDDMSPRAIARIHRITH